MLLTQRREKSYPMDRVSEFRNLLLLYSHLLEDVILALLALWELRRISIFL
jgi:hypothetical protein